MIISSIPCLVLGTEHISRWFPGRAAGRLSPLERGRERHLHGRPPKLRVFLESPRGWFVREQRMDGAMATASIVPASVEMDTPKKPSLSPLSAWGNVTAGPTLPSADSGAEARPWEGCVAASHRACPGTRVSASLARSLGPPIYLASIQADPSSRPFP